ncbi:MAG TPA: DUF4153 domain-containing protein [Erysipelotrichaceae bacterium]|nr:DUF4153 domain-containing protein [Erysipelotrichaceae bacterium]
MQSVNTILNHIEDPKALETYYRHDEQGFRTAFTEAFEMYPDALILKVWNERLSDSEPVRLKLLDRSFILMAVLGILSALTMRLMVYLIDDFTIAPINVLFAILPFMSLYLMFTQAMAKRLRLIIIGFLITLMIYFNFLPNDSSDVILLTYLHLPILLWLMWGMSHAGDRYKEVNSRISFLKFNGGFLVLYILFALAGMALAGITMMLFSLLGMDISELYFENIVVMGIAGLALVASYAVQRYGRLAQSIAPLLAKVFSPLVLITLLIYLISMLVLGKNPFMDRDFLISFNVILVLVLAITIYLITERNPSQSSQFMDILNFSLIVCALIINGVALIAMAFRLTSFGITPNRLTSLVLNILIMIHMIRIGVASLRFLQKKGSMLSVQTAVTTWFPVYGIWALIVIVVFPLIF